MAAYCSRAERCPADIRKKLTALEISPREQDKIIAYLEQQGFVDEARFARAFVNDKSRYNGWGAYKITFELRNRHIAPAIIDEALRSINPDESHDRLTGILKQKLRSIKGANAYEVKQKLVRFAVGRGFSLDEIEKGLRELRMES